VVDHAGLEIAARMPADHAGSGCPAYSHAPGKRRARARGETEQVAVERDRRVDVVGEDRSGSSR
jgi:hypothetical protein